jgi:hypothetical protein
VPDLRNALDPGWLEQLDAVGEPAQPFTLPAAEDLPPVLLDLAVPHEDVDAVVRDIPAPDRNPDVWWLLTRCAHALVRHMGTVDRPPDFPTIAALPPYFYVHVYLAVLPHVRAYHRRLGVDEEVSRRTLADLGRVMAVHRRVYGTGGMDVPYWPTLHFHGVLYQLGRLQFERARLGRRTGAAVRAAGLPYGPGDPALAVHVPAFYGPLTPRACDESFAHAREFFARHHPDERYAVAVCRSWLLDRQLAGYLPADANILAFQRRFRLAYRPDPDDHGVLRFVFGAESPDLDELPRESTLQRAIVDHLRSGGHWHGGAGWLPL